jgi:hypothetical protein
MVLNGSVNLLYLRLHVKFCRKLLRDGLFEKRKQPMNDYFNKLGRRPLELGTGIEPIYNSSAGNKW